MYQILERQVSILGYGSLTHVQTLPFINIYVYLG